MKKSNIIRLIVSIAVILLLAASVCTVLAFSSSAADGNVYGGEKIQTIQKTESLERLTAVANHFVVMKHKQLGGTHYAYTAALAETATAADIYKEYNFDAGSQMVILSILDNSDGTYSTYEKVVVNCTNGVVRDPSVSMDGTKVLYSMKENTYDDFHIYELDLTDKKLSSRQLTFGNGRSDIEPQYLANGNIVFSSNRSVQTVDCWITPVSNLYVMDGDGSNVRRVGYDQVHTTFPTVTSDGRVLYTRWDYNDRTQMFVQGVFQMFQDGTYQTEVFGNDANFPTTLLHTRDIPGSTGKYVSIASGHHVQQIGKLCIIDSSVGRNEQTSVHFVFPDSASAYRQNVDGYGQDGRVYKYPYAIDENTILVSSIDKYSGKNTPFSIYLCDPSKGWDASVELVKGTTAAPASQIVPIRTGKVFNRISTVDYSSNVGTYYVANVYEGEAMKGVQPGTVKYLRVVELVYRSSAIGATFTKGYGEGDPFSPIATGNGAWDVKAVLGIVPVEEDGSALFNVPSDTPVYFQLLDDKGCVIQTMRSWSTLMPGETFSCVGCHENKNTAPSAGGGVTMAMKKGVQYLQKDFWMQNSETYADFDPYKDKAIGFSYNEMIQSIFDESCVQCHSNTAESLDKIGAKKANADASLSAMNYIIPSAAQWNYSVAGGKSGTHSAPFGNPTASQSDVNTAWTGGELTLKNDFVFTQYNAQACVTALELRYSGSVTVRINGKTVYSGNASAVTSVRQELTEAQVGELKTGVNEIELTVSGGTHYIDCALFSGVPDTNLIMIERASDFRYQMSANAAVDADWYKASYDDSAWKIGQAPFGDRNDVAKANTAWSGSQAYLWLRKDFTLTAEQIASMNNEEITFNIFYDDTMKMYVNDVLVMDKSGWNDSYELLTISQKPQNLFKPGKNVIALSLHNSGGGREIDFAMFCATKSEHRTSSAPFSLQSMPVVPESNRMQRTYPLSYLFLTGSTPSNRANQTPGIQWVGSPSGKYVKWISVMSSPEGIEPYTAGSFNSLLVSKIRSGHGNLTENQIRAIECWIDLAVPCMGTYDENEAFNDEAQRMFTERENKRNFYEQWDRYVKMGLGGVLPQGSVELTYTAGSKEYTAKGDGYALLDVNRKYSAGDVVTLKVSGSSYVALTVNERQGESLLYLPDGTYTFTIPASMANNYNLMMRASGNGYYRSFTMLARIPTEDELSSVRDLALNPYDLDNGTGAFPHASSGATVDGSNHEARNAIDGFINTGYDRSYPYQSWSPASASGALKIDFGREVKANTLQILLRGASSDVTVLSAEITFSDGTVKEVLLGNTSEFVTVDLGGKTISSLTIGNFKTITGGAFAITEVRVIGSEK